jgi:hypothetical protein
VSPDIQLEKTSSDTTANEGADATLVCHATGRPHPTIIWKREDGQSFLVKQTKKMGESHAWAYRKSAEKEPKRAIKQ